MTREEREEKAWKRYMGFLEPLRDDPAAYERMEPYAWQILQEDLGLKPKLGVLRAVKA